MAHKIISILQGSSASATLEQRLEATNAQAGRASRASPWLIFTHNLAAYQYTKHMISLHVSCLLQCGQQLVTSNLHIIRI